MTVPIGYDESGQPTGLTMIADYLGEPDLIAVGYAWNRRRRRAGRPIWEHHRRCENNI
jgi:Asp-tRNA(Asn)/Glu-tRNA(Gln) amidotransferase A subunit family amidase